MQADGAGEPIAARAEVPWSSCSPKAVRSLRIEVFSSGTRRERQGFDGFRRETYGQQRRSNPAGLAWLCGREENEEISLVDGLLVAGPRVKLGKVARRRLLVRHVRLPLSSNSDSTGRERR